MHYKVKTVNSKLAQAKEFISADNFKSLDSNKAEKKGDDDEFEQQRKATIAEAVQAKEDGSSKRFGGGQKQVL